eukprot:CAMPEP_0197693892 /NCGR_PEP_ID=MMETSP1338-20131121/113133_1 /TAXON_ID=43686 ORGANISM="Pelagodinium beii, Strain RCC1491" /NCGR_SAMPLE_ID=MMETSP1338 /ASSEMBLY_ACC=CAM_ASM_000754 /LENGTH=76 /DNA_ID=CAMNT_0043276683 /DNA_START=115 /DNA_END=341 /DNA_ORIENTATION=-
MLVLVVCLGVMFGMFLSAVLARTSMYPFNDGMSYAGCHAAKLVDSSLSGTNTSGSAFLGLIPTLEVLDRLTASLKS